MALDEMLRVLGAHDLNFECAGWSVHLDENYEGDAIKRDRRLLLEGQFGNWPLWKGTATARLVSHDLDNVQHDAAGRPICGLLSWTSGFDISTGDIEGFENGTIEVASIITPGTFDNILTLLQGKGIRPVVNFRMSKGLPGNWDGREPLSVNSVHFYVRGR